MHSYQLYILKAFIILITIPVSQILKAQSTDTAIIENLDRPTYRTIISVGFGYRIHPIDAPLGFEGHEKRLKSGLVARFETGFFLDKKNGLGIQYNRNMCRSEGPNTIIYDPTSRGYFYIPYIETISANYIGPVYTQRRINSIGISYISFSIGYLQMTRRIKTIETDIFQGRSIGFSAAFGYDFSRWEKFGINLSTGFTYGVIRSGHLTSLSGRKPIELENPVSLIRVEITAGLRIF